MGLETASFIDGLVVTNPTAADPKSQGDDHLRLLKSTIKATLPGLTGAVTATQAELNILDGATLSTAELNILDGVTATTAELNILDGATLTTAELNFVDGVTSAIQTQLNAKADITGEEYTGTHDFSAAGSVLVPTPTLGAQAVTKTYADGLSFAAALPAQTGNSGKIVSTDGTTASWVEPSFGDDRFRIKGSGDATKILAFEADTNVPTGTTVTLTAPATSGTVALTSDLAVAVNSSVSVNNGNGYGSTNTVIRRFSVTLLNVGTAITYADSATLGGTFTINETGTYVIECGESLTSTGAFGVSVNSAQLTTSIGSITQANRLGIYNNQQAATQGATLAICVRLTAGDVVRHHSDSVSTNTNYFTFFKIRKVTI